MNDRNENFDIRLHTAEGKILYDITEDMGYILDCLFGASNSQA